MAETALDPHPAVAAPPAVCLGPSTARAPVAYFGPDLSDSALRRRVGQWTYAGFSVVTIAFARRAADIEPRQDVICCGPVLPRSRWGRIPSMARAAVRIAQQRRRLRGVALFVGRNLDNALLALFARWASRSGAPFVYEILDVNRSCTQSGIGGTLLRLLEKWVLRHANLLVVSSPYFVSEYYEKVLGYRRNWLLFENKVPHHVHAARRASPLGSAPVVFSKAHTSSGRRPWRVGWFGYLDDERSWAILRHLAQSLPDDVLIYVRGIPYADFDMERFVADLQHLPNVVYGGAYRNPEDLPALYNSVDLVWSVDCNVPDANSRWLLTNGLYEAGYFGKPVIGLAENAVGRFAAQHGIGWALDGPSHAKLADFIRHLSPEDYQQKRQAITELRTEFFVESDEIERIWNQVGAAGRRDRGASSATVQTTTDAAAAHSKVLCIGLFPPPVDGQRIITQCVLERFAAVADVVRCDIDSFQALGRASKLVSTVRACYVLIRERIKGNKIVYLSPHSGAGLACSCVIALIAQRLGCSLTLHYHSYWNIGRRSLLMAAFVAACGPDARHVVLAAPMASEIQRFYPSIRNVSVVSNCAFITAPTTMRETGKHKLRVGHLSNLSREKGLGTVFQCLRALRARDINVELWLAGPANDREAEGLIAEAQDEFSDRLHYFGRLDSHQVQDFYNEIDVFLFPTVHRHEAEPLVVIDAMAAGVAVIATDRGCIPHLLGMTAGRALRLEHFVDRAVEQIALWANDPSRLVVASHEARARFFEVQRESKTQLDGLIADVLGLSCSAAAGVR